MGQLAAVGAAVLGVLAILPSTVRSLGPGTDVEVRVVRYADGRGAAYESAPKRMAWEVRKRTSVETKLTADQSRFDDPRIFESPFLYWSGREGFPAMSEAETVGLRRFVEFGGFVLVDDARPEKGEFLASVRRELARALPESPLHVLPPSHTVYRSFYLIDRPVGRVEGPAELLGLEAGERTAVVVSAHDIGGAVARDNLGAWEAEVSPGGSEQRERAERLVVNLVMYALCLDYKDDQVHAPFIMRRRGRLP